MTAMKQIPLFVLMGISVISIMTIPVMASSHDIGVKDGSCFFLDLNDQIVEAIDATITKTDNSLQCKGFVEVAPDRGIVERDANSIFICGYEDANGTIIYDSWTLTITPSETAVLTCTNPI